jgi:hypothetical protein
MRKLLLITASSDEIRSARTSRFLSFQQITMPYWPPESHPAGRYLTLMKRPKISIGPINPMSLA